LLNEYRAFMCDPTVDSMSTALVKACTSRAQSEAVARAARSYAMEHFGWDGFVDFVRTTYIDALRDTRERVWQSPVA
jgi:glycosyltransferase involved in cell wall biosynthesis